MRSSSMVTRLPLFINAKKYQIKVNPDSGLLIEKDVTFETNFRFEPAIMSRKGVGPYQIFLPMPSYDKFAGEDVILSTDNTLL